MTRLILALSILLILPRPLVIPWTRNMAAPEIIFLKPDTLENMAGAWVHEMCHIRQFREGRIDGRSVRDIELECSCEEYFFYESIGYLAGMDKVLHYAIPEY